MIKVSVLIPVYNVENYIIQCLESVQRQQLKEIEMICVDDGSTDRSGEILDQYAKKDARILVIHKENTGYGNSMNLALDSANGEYIAIVESDDFIEPDMLFKLYQTAVEQNAEVVKANHFNYCRGQDSFSDRLQEYPKNERLNVFCCPKILNLADTIWSCLYNRDFLLRNRIRFHETPGASFQDISFSLQVWLKAESVYFIPDAVLHYRNDNPDSSMHNPYKVFCVIEEYEWLEEKFQEMQEKWASDQNLKIENLEIEKYFVASKYRDYLNHYYRVASQYQYALLLRIVEFYKIDLQKKRIQESAFLPIVYQAISSAYQDINSFFQRTAKDQKDLRLGSCRFENEVIYGKALIQHMFSFPQVIVYGAGKIGQWFVEQLKQKGFVPDCFVVTERTEDERICNGIPVYSLYETIELADSCAVILAVAENNQYELYQNLIRYRFQHIFRVDSIIKNRLSQIL